ncbi:hypothetical protein V9664_09550 [Streptococcus suis]|uniref:hypothetical protein n=1 Tax=Streptococcus suis TaxID=1307 RepID=UPI00300FBAAC
MSRIVNFGNGITARQRDVIDDFKDAIERYEFLENENERLIKDRQEQEKKIDFLKQQNHHEVEEERIFRSEEMIAKVYKLRNRFTRKIKHDWIEWRTGFND